MADDERPGDGADDITAEHEHEESENFGPRKRINWIAVRTFFLTNQDVKLVQVAEKFGISMAALSKRAKAENWKGIRRNHYDKTTNILENEHADKLVEHRLKHAKLTGDVVKILQDIVDDIQAYGFTKADGTQITSTMTKVEIAAVLSQAAMKASEADRLNLGLKIGELARDEQKDDAPIEIVQRTLVPEKIPVNAEGRLVEEKAS